MNARFRHWTIWSAQFSARTQREKAILLVAALALAYVAVDALWLGPAVKAYKAEQKSLALKQSELAQLTAQIAQLAEQMRVQEQQTRAALDAATRDMETVGGRLAEFERTLVPANRMSEFLRGLLPGGAIEVLSMKTLPPTPLLARPAPAADGKAASAIVATPGTSAVATRPAVTPAANLYKHGVEITLAGSYPALLDYLSRLENSPQKVLWGRLDLRAEKYPHSELTLVLYTLSLDSSWLIV